jgi:ribosome-associated toxin RatA of RatAB toxin-antitoxin module
MQRHRATQEWKPDDNPFDLEAELKVGFGGLEETYVSRVVGQPYESVTVSLTGDLLRYLHSTRTFDLELEPESAADLVSGNSG